jgi:NAD(P)-dependent dehydrogenase (short-subunit alcohol dehydrogenase family)
MSGIEGKKVLVTGGTKGIGRGMAAALREAGAEVIVTGRTEAGADPVGRFVQLDLAAGRAAIEEAAVRLWRETGGLDVVFNNAGGSSFWKPISRASSGPARASAGLCWSVDAARSSM